MTGKLVVKDPPPKAARIQVCIAAAFTKSKFPSTKESTYPSQTPRLTR
jgi:hypothetical protein